MRCASVENSSSVNAISVTLRRKYRLRDCRAGRRLFPGSGPGKRAALRKPLEHTILIPKSTMRGKRGGAVMSYHHIRVEPASRHVGAEIEGVDLSVPIADEVLAEIRDAFGQYGVAFFRDQKLTPEQHVAIAGRFGPINVNRFFATVPGYPMIAE